MKPFASNQRRTKVETRARATSHAASLVVSPKVPKGLRAGGLKGRCD